MHTHAYKFDSRRPPEQLPTSWACCLLSIIYLLYSYCISSIIYYLLSIIYYLHTYNEYMICNSCQISLLRLFLQRFVDSKSPGDSLRTRECQPLRLRICPSANPPKSGISVRRLGVLPGLVTMFLSPTE